MESGHSFLETALLQRHVLATMQNLLYVTEDSYSNRSGLNLLGKLDRVENFIES